MSEPTLQELKELILNLDKKVETGFVKLEGEIKRVEETLKGEIKGVEAKIDGLDKRLSNEEALSRTVFGGLMLAVCVGVIKYLFFPKA